MENYEIVFFQKNENILNAFKSSWKERDNHDFSQKQRVPVGLNTVFSKKWFSLLPLKSSRKEHFFLKKIKFLLFREKRCFTNRIGWKSGLFEPQIDHRAKTVTVTSLSGIAYFFPFVRHRKTSRSSYRLLKNTSYKETL